VLWLSENRDYFLPHGDTIGSFAEDENGDFQPYLDRMGTLREFGDEITLLACSEVLSVEIHVLQPDNTVHTHRPLHLHNIREQRPRKFIMLLFHPEQLHYDCIIQASPQIPPPILQPQIQRELFPEEPQQLQRQPPTQPTTQPPPPVLRPQPQGELSL